MKKIISSILITCISSVFYAQTPNIPIKTPDVTAFINANFLPVNEYTGKSDITIPLCTINFGQLNIPISISYNTGGVNINSMASSVGLNWSLNAGGMISKETVGYQDTYSNCYYHSEEADFVYTSFGYLSNLFDNNHYYTGGGLVGNIIPDAYRDMQPDRFFAAAPGLKTKFVHKSNGKPMELTATNSIIESPFDAPPPIDPATQIYFKITSSNGLKYTFDKPEMYYVIPEYRDGSVNFPLTDELVDAPWPTTMSLSTLNQNISSLAGGYQRWIKSSVELFPVIHLSSILDPLTGQSVQFSYSTNTLVDNNRRIERTFRQDYTGTAPNYVSQMNFEHDYDIEQVLDKITFPEGTINFIYAVSRLDIRGGKILSKIEVKNNSGTLIKGILFEHDYFSVTSCTDPLCYRLRLTGVKFYDQSNNSLPGYSFTYNTTQLPKRYSLNQDFLGYFNGNNGILSKNYVPTIYRKANQLKNTNIPFPLPQAGYQYLLGNASLVPNLSFAKAATIEKITYPSGGFSLFDYELNSFKFLGYEVQGGGLRISAQSLYNNDNSLKRKIIYNYNDLNGLTSGSVNNLPGFLSKTPLDGTSITPPSYLISQSLTNRLEITNSSWVGYSRCRIEEQNNGYTINTYSGIPEYPNLSPTTYTLPADPNSMGGPGSDVTDLNLQINEGFVPSIYKDLDIKRGNLMTSYVYDNNNVLLKSTTNTYGYNAYDVINESQPITFGPDHYNNYVYLSKAYALYQTQLSSENSFLTETVTQEKSSVNSSVINLHNTYLYNTTRPLLTEKQMITSTGAILKNKVYYPFDDEVSTLPNMSSLNNLNILVPVKTMKYKNSALINTTLTSYSNFGGNLIFPSSISQAIGNNALEIKNNFSRYNTVGKILEEQIGNNYQKSYIYNYDNSHIIAEVSNAPYNEIAYTSFEETSYGNFDTYNSTRTTVVPNSTASNMPPTGNTYYSLTTGITKSGLTAGKQYIVSYWTQNLSSLTIVGTTGIKGRTINGWTYYEHVVTASGTSINISGSGNIDELRLYPKGAQMTTYTYVPLIGLTSKCDLNNRIIYYEYDTFGRLKLIRDQDENIIKRFDYQYQQLP